MGRKLNVAIAVMILIGFIVVIAMDNKQAQVKEQEEIAGIKEMVAYPSLSGDLSFDFYVRNPSEKRIARWYVINSYSTPAVNGSVTINKEKELMPIGSGYINRTPFYTRKVNLIGGEIIVIDTFSGRKDNLYERHEIKIRFTGLDPKYPVQIGIIEGDEREESDRPPGIEVAN